MLSKKPRKKQQRVQLWNVLQGSRDGTGAGVKTPAIICPFGLTADTVQNPVTLATLDPEYESYSYEKWKREEGG
jgi:hypothetical protein